MYFGIHQFLFDIPKPGIGVEHILHQRVKLHTQYLCGLAYQFIESTAQAYPQQISGC